MTRTAASSGKRYAALGIPEYWQYAPHHQYLTEDLLGWQLRDGAYVPIPLQLDRRRGAWVGRSPILGTDWELDVVTGTLRLWNPVHRRWYLTVQESGTAHEREAARAAREATRAREAEAEIARLQALLQRQGNSDV